MTDNFHIKEFSQGYVLLRKHWLPNKKPNAQYWILSHRSLIRGVPETPKQQSLLPLLLATQQNLITRPYCVRYTYFGHKTQRSQVGTSQEAFFCLVSLHGTRRYLLRSLPQGKGAINSLTQLRTTIRTYVERYGYGHNSGMNVMGQPPTLCLNLRPAQQKETHTWCCKSSLEHMTGSSENARRNLLSLLCEIDIVSCWGLWTPTDPEFPVNNLFS